MDVCTTVLTYGSQIGSVNCFDWLSVQKMPIGTNSFGHPITIQHRPANLTSNLADLNPQKN